MKRMWFIAIVAACALGTASCSGFLEGEDVTQDPNNPTTATREALFMGVQAATFGQQESSVPLTICMWIQQCTGGGGRFVEQFGHYTIDETSHSFDFNSVYTGGGLVDIRKIEASAAGAGDQQFVGIAQIYEAFVIGSAADVWGNIPYSQAGQSTPPPTLDNQLAVYAAVQTLLSTAITNLTGPGPGPGDRDLVFAGDVAAWTEVAHTLKARYFLHTVEAAAAGLIPGRSAAQVYADVVAEALLGISDPANDFRALHGNPTSERNVWYQFSQTTFGSDLVAGKRLVDIMNARSDPRRAEYFGRNELNGYGGDDVNTAQPAASVSPLDGTRNSPTFRQPFVTYAENELILAEAYNRSTPPNDALAATHWNNERATVPLPTPILGITGAALLDSIMTEKYVAMFQNIEAWSDYRRTCIPALTPYARADAVYGGKVPGRLFYGSNERNTNPNIPLPSAQLSTNGFRNPNDPNPCP